MSMYHAQKQHRMRRMMITVAIIVCVVAALIPGVLALRRTVSANMVETGAESVRSAVLESAVQCYAIEGAYPSDIRYLEDNYGLQINDQTYIVSYEAIAPNVAPSVKVLVRGSSS